MVAVGPGRDEFRLLMESMAATWACRVEAPVLGIYYVVEGILDPQVKVSEG